MGKSSCWNWDRILLIVILLLLAIDILMHAAVVAQSGKEKTCQAANNNTSAASLCLPALPMRYIHQNPECTNKLIDAMNITNVRIG
jgi:hypothetical protein